MDELLGSYIPPPKTLPGFPKAAPVKPKTPMGGGKLRKRWKDSDSGDILEWDYQHGKLERYNDNGKHLGEYDPITGRETKPADSTRTITPTIIGTKRRTKMKFYLTWFEKNGDAYLGESVLLGVDENQVRKVFHLSSDESPGDCFIIGSDKLEWLRTAAKGVDVQLGEFDYFVEACA